MKNFVELKTRAGGLWPFGLFFKKRIGFLFTQYAWFFAFDELNVSPDDFNKLDQGEQLASVAAGAANYWNMKRGNKKRYTTKEMTDILMKATMEQNKKIGMAMVNASWPEWMNMLSKKDGDREIAKKKSGKKI